MSAISHLLRFLVPLLFASAWASYAILFLHDPLWARRAARLLLPLTMAAQASLIVAEALLTRRCPMGNLAEILQVLALSVAAVYLFLETRQRNRYTGVFLLTLLLPVVVFSVVMSPPSGPVPALLKSPLFGAHTLLALLGYAALIVCTVYGVMYLLLHRTLKRQTFGLIFQRFPSLDGLSDMTVGAAGIAFLALTLTIVVGIVWGLRAVRADQIHLQGSLWSDPKIAFTVTVWAFYGLGLVARRFRRPGRSVIFLFLAGFAVAVLAVILLNTWLTTFHRFTS